jgi:hypothetical protein
LADALAEVTAATATALASGETDQAYRTLLPVLSWPAPQLSEPAAFSEAFVLFAEITRAFAGDELAALVSAVASRPDDVQALYDAGYQLYEQHLWPVAATLFARANALAPGQAPIVGELAASLEGMMAYGPAAMALDASGLPERDPMLAYLSGYNWLMVGDLDLPRRRLAQLEGVTHEPIPHVREVLAGMLARADAVQGAGLALDERALTAWQVVISGSLLTHESPFGHEGPMFGRYAYVADSARLMREGIERLVRLLELAQRPLSRVVVAPSRESRPLAHAVARRTGLPLAEWDGRPSGLVVAWSMDGLQDATFLQGLREHAPDQVLFVHTSSWVDPFPYSPDVTTLLHQHVTHPWTGGALRVVEGGVEPAEPDPRSDEELAEEILSAELAEGSASSLEHVLAVAAAALSVPEPHRAGLGRTHGPRHHQRAGSPVPSNRFA